jgi:hypothetical protein
MLGLDFHREWADLDNFTYAQMVERCIAVSKKIEDKETQLKLGEQHRPAYMVEGYGAHSGGQQDRAFQWGPPSDYQGNMEQAGR